MLIRRLEVGPFASNCYIVGSETGPDGLIIDPGAEPEEVLRAVAEMKLDIKLIVLTHGHMDHFDGAGVVQKSTGAELAMHAEDAPMLNRQPLNGLFPGPRPAPPTPDRLLNGGESLEVGGLSFLVLHTPGHSPGGICLLGQGALFSGDTLFNFGIGRYDFPGGSYDQLMNSIHTKLMVLPDDTRVYPGHGPETTIGMERRANPFLQDE
ncbi:MAG: MBL fold metallo-hydrolase [Chloroflexota bacterium]